MKKILFSVLIVAAIMTSCQPPQQTTESVDQKNTTIETIMKRRSIRSFTTQQISTPTLDTIIQCAINAPSARNEQPWEVRFIQNAELINKIEDGFNAYQKMQNPSKEPSGKAFYGAPTIAIVAAKKDSRFGQLDCGWLGQNILLSATALNIGTCVVGGITPFLNTPEAKPILEKLQFSDDYQILYSIALGYSNQVPDAKPRDAKKVQVIN